MEVMEEEVMVEEVMAVATEVEVQVTEDTEEEVTDIQGTCNSIFLFTIKSKFDTLIHSRPNQYYSAGFFSKLNYV